MNISAKIDDNELDFSIELAGNQIWELKRIGDTTGKTFGKISFENGLIGIIEIDSEIDTPTDIILERLIEEFKEYNDVRQMGFEAETDGGGNGKADMELKPYDPESIRVRPLVLSAFQINKDITDKVIDLNPEFQRNFVWDDTRKSRLIESMLLKIPLPAFYFAEDRDGNFQVVDGLQRLTVINKFLNNQFKLKNLEYLKGLEGLYYKSEVERSITEKSALQEPYRGRVERTQLNINVIEASSPLKVKYDIFLRINTSGRPLNHQEIRNCFSRDEIRETLKRMADSDEFLTATGHSVTDTRMDAQELALRFLGFYFYREIYAGDMKSFLDAVVDKLNEVSKPKLVKAEKLFYTIMKNAYHLFGEYSFRKCLPEHLVPGYKRQLINKSMFVAWAIILSKIDTDVIMKKPKNQFISILASKLKEDNELFVSLTTGTTDKSKVDYVFLEFQKLLEDYLIS